MKIKNISLKTNAVAITALSTVFLFSCKKESDPSGINYQFKTTSTTSPVARTMGTISWTAGYASATEIEFEAKSKDVKVEYKSKATQKINLFSPLSTLGVVALPAGTYKEVEFEIELLPSGSDAAFELSGTYSGTPIVFKVNEAFEIDTEKESADIVNGTSYTAVTSLNLSLITQGVTSSMLNSATLTNGKIIVSASSNANIYAIMLENLKNLDDCEFKK